MKFFNWVCFSYQGGGEAPKNLSGRLVAATWWLFGFIVIASYTANLAAFLTVSRLETPVDSLDELSKQYKIQFSPMKGSDSMTYFERMANIEEKFYEYVPKLFKNLSMLSVNTTNFRIVRTFSNLFLKNLEGDVTKRLTNGI